MVFIIKINNILFVDTLLHIITCVRCLNVSLLPGGNVLPLTQILGGN